MGASSEVSTSIRIESLPTATGTARLVVERAMDWSVDGVFWAAGTNVLAARTSEVAR